MEISNAEMLAYQCYTTVMFVVFYCIGFKVENDLIRIMLALLLAAIALLVLTYFLGFPSWN